MKITALRPQKRSKKRLAVFVDGGFAFSLDRTTVKQFRLKPGCPVDPELLADIVLNEQLRHCREYALLLLSYRARSEKELKDRLNKKGYTPEVIDAVMTELKRQGLVDDRKLAERYVGDRITIGHKGKKMVRAELLKMGVAKEEINRALAKAPDETEAAMMVVEHFLPRYRKLDARTRARRLWGVLARRGFAADTIATVMKELGAEPLDVTE